MTKNQNREEEIKKLLEFIAHSSTGASLDDIFIEYNSFIPKRTLQYRLLHLVKAGILKKEGAHRSTRYYRRKAESQTAENKALTLPTKSIISSIIVLSAEAKEVQKARF